MASSSPIFSVPPPLEGLQSDSPFSKRSRLAASRSHPNNNNSDNNEERASRVKEQPQAAAAAGQQHDVSHDAHSIGENVSVSSFGSDEDGHHHYYNSEKPPSNSVLVGSVSPQPKAPWTGGQQTTIVAAEQKHNPSSLVLSIADAGEKRQQINQIPIIELQQRQRISDLLADNQRKTAALDELKVLFEKLTNDYDAVSKEARGKALSLSSLQEHTLAIEAEQKLTAAKCAMQEEKIANFHSEWRSKTAHMRKQHEELQAERDELHKQRNELLESHRALRTQVEELQQSLADAKEAFDRQVSQKTAEIETAYKAAYQEKDRLLRLREEEMEREARRLEDGVHNVAAENSAAKEVVDTMRWRMKEMERVLEKKDLLRTHLERSLADVRRQVADMEQTVERERLAQGQRHADNEASWQAQVTAMRQLYEQERVDKNRALAEIRELRRQHEVYLASTEEDRKARLEKQTQCEWQLRQELNSTKAQLQEAVERANRDEAALRRAHREAEVASSANLNDAAQRDTLQVRISEKERLLAQTESQLKLTMTKLAEKEKEAETYRCTLERALWLKQATHSTEHNQRLLQITDAAGSATQFPTLTREAPHPSPAEDFTHANNNNNNNNNNNVTPSRRPPLPRKAETIDRNDVSPPQQQQGTWTVLHQYQHSVPTAAASARRYSNTAPSNSPYSYGHQFPQRHQGPNNEYNEADDVFFDNTDAVATTHFSPPPPPPLTTTQSVPGPLPASPSSILRRSRRISVVAPPTTSSSPLASLTHVPPYRELSSARTRSPPHPYSGAEAILRDAFAPTERRGSSARNDEDNADVIVRGGDDVGLLTGEDLIRRTVQEVLRQDRSHRPHGGSHNTTANMFAPPPPPVTVPSIGTGKAGGAFSGLGDLSAVSGTALPDAAAHGAASRSTMATSSTPVAPEEDKRKPHGDTAAATADMPLRHSAALFQSVNSSWLSQPSESAILCAQQSDSLVPRKASSSLSSSQPAASAAQAAVDPMEAIVASYARSRAEAEQRVRDTLAELSDRQRTLLEAVENTNRPPSSQHRDAGIALTYYSGDEEEEGGYPRPSHDAEAAGPIPSSTPMSERREANQQLGSDDPLDTVTPTASRISTVQQRFLHQPTS